MSPDTATMLDDIAACGLPVLPVDLTFPAIDPKAETSARAVVELIDCCFDPSPARRAELERRRGERAQEEAVSRQLSAQAQARAAAAHCQQPAGGGLSETDRMVAAITGMFFGGAS